MRKLFQLKHLVLFTFVGLSLSAFILKDHSVFTDVFDDGPYIFITNEEAKEGVEKSIRAGEVKTEEVKLNRVSFMPEAATYSGVERIAALSDIHGQHELFLKILRTHGIIDGEDNWAFGKGHFVITGDIFDRGDQVTEALWFVYELEKQAKAAGGKVHYLLGNHEYMVLHGDNRYVNDKYITTAKLLESSHKELFSRKTVLGRWLRSKSTIIRINDKLFVHGGLSETFANLGMSLEETNTLYRESIDTPKEVIKANDVFMSLYDSKGLIWYRGYFRDDLSKELISSVLAKYGASSIMVGHTSQSQVLEKYDGLVYAIDSSIKKGKSGEILFIEGDQFIRGTMEGERLLF